MDPGGGSPFPETAWSMILQLRRSDAEQRRGLEVLCRGYWRPIETFLRQALRVAPNEAGDLTQGFFAWVLEAPVLSRYDAEKGSFRSFLRGLLRNFVRNQRREEDAQKRGGGDRGLELGAVPGHLLTDRRSRSPEEAFDQAWVDELIDRATNRVRAQLREEGKAKELALFEAYEFPPPSVLPTYQSVAEAHGVSGNTVRHQLYKIRERVRAELRAELRETVADAAQLEEEWSSLFAGGD